jgi:hypothetical protein
MKTLYTAVLLLFSITCFGQDSTTSTLSFGINMSQALHPTDNEIPTLSIDYKFKKHYHIRGQIGFYNVQQEGSGGSSTFNNFGSNDIDTVINKNPSSKSNFYARLGYLRDIPLNQRTNLYLGIDLSYATNYWVEELELRTERSFNPAQTTIIDFRQKEKANIITYGLSPTVGMSYAISSKFTIGAEFQVQYYRMEDYSAKNWTMTQTSSFNSQFFQNDYNSHTQTNSNRQEFNPLAGLYFYYTLPL